MTEGGLLYWKVQKIKYSGPVADYSQVLKPLPDPPKGMVWKKDETTGEWSVIEKNPSKVCAEIEVSSSSKNIDKSKLDDKDNDEWEVLDADGSKRKKKIDESSSPPQHKDTEVNYVEHLVLPTDTFMGLCLNYKISPVKIRQANNFSGSNLLLAPKKLKIPIDGKNIIQVKTQDVNSKEYKIQTLFHQFPFMSISEVKAYLEISDWKIDDAIKDAKEDREWELKQLDSTRKCMHGHQAHNEVHEGVPVAASGAALKTFTVKELEMRPLL